MTLLGPGDEEATGWDTENPEKELVYDFDDLWLRSSSFFDAMLA